MFSKIQEFLNKVVTNGKNLGATILVMIGLVACFVLITKAIKDFRENKMKEAFIKIGLCVLIGAIVGLGATALFDFGQTLKPNDVFTFIQPFLLSI